MCVTKQLEGFGRVPSRILRIQTFVDFALVLRKNCGQPKLWNHDEICEAVKLVPLYQRRSIRDLAAALGMPKSILHCLKCDKDNPAIIPCTSAL